MIPGNMPIHKWADLIALKLELLDMGRGDLSKRAEHWYLEVMRMENELFAANARIGQLELELAEAKELVEGLKTSTALDEPPEAA